MDRHATTYFDAMLHSIIYEKPNNSEINHVKIK